MTTKHNIKKIIISRTDAIGDVILTLPICGIIKQFYPNIKILFLGRSYTKDVINCCEHVDEFINADEVLKLADKDAVLYLKSLNADGIIHVFPNKRISKISKKAKIKLRVGTTNRIFHWGTANKLVRLSRKNSTLHESQLNCKLLEPLEIFILPDLKEMASFTGFSRIPELTNSGASVLDKNKTKIILHPKSNASAREWSLDHYASLIKQLPKDHFQFFISGTAKEKELLAGWIKTLPPEVVDLTGKFTLNEFIAFINQADYLVAASTGPLHIAAACGIGAIGIYPPIQPMHPGRWQPIGKKAQALVVNKACSDCRKNPQSCNCINEIEAKKIADIIRK